MNGRGHFDCGRINETHKCYGRDPCLGGPQCVQARRPLFHDCREKPWPLEEFPCSGHQIRLRLINGAGNAPIKLWIDQHELVVVARDGVETEPFTTPYVVMAVGQRLDVIVRCSAGRPVVPKKYLIYATLAIGFLPEGADEPKILEFVTSLLTYSGSQDIQTPQFLPHTDPTRGTRSPLIENKMKSH